MSWLVLVVSGVLEAVSAVALGRSEGFTRLGPSLVFAGGLLISMVGHGMVTGDEAVTAIKVALILGLVGCIVGRKLTH